MFDRKKAIDQKNKIQEIAVKGSMGYLRLLLTWATGCGKTLAALKIIKNDFKYRKDIKGYLICKERAHLDNWNENIKEHGMEFIDEICTKFLYASLHKYQDKGFVDFVILDECHAININRMNKLKSIIGPNTRVIYLSATVDSLHKFTWKYHLGDFSEYHISISQAIEMGILPHPTLYIHYYQMDETINIYEAVYKEYGKKKVIGNLTQKRAYKVYSDLVEKFKGFYEEKNEKWAMNLMKNVGSARKRMLASFKTENAKILLDTYMKDTRRIIFCGSKEQAELMSFNYVHSGRTSKYNKNIKDNFNDFKINELAVVNMFREAINLVNIEKGLIIQLDSVKLSFIQMLGRVFRSDIPEMHVMIYKETQDENYLRNALKGFDMKYVKEVYHYEN